jgi:hypothetical protein
MYQIRDEAHFEKKMAPMKASLSSNNVRLFPLKRQTITWDALFKKANQYRKSNKLPDNEFVLLLTDIANKQNWFAALDESMPYNGFIHTADWDYYIKCSAAFPIAYEVIALVLQKHMFNGMYYSDNLFSKNYLFFKNLYCSLEITCIFTENAAFIILV